MIPTPQWDAEGESVNLAAAAADGLEWLRLMHVIVVNQPTLLKRPEENIWRLTACIRRLEALIQEPPQPPTDNNPLSPDK
jgi:hypothetical protein